MAPAPDSNELLWPDDANTSEKRPCVLSGTVEAADKKPSDIRDIDQSRHTHEDLSDMMALVEAARTVLAATARSFAHIQMGSQRG